MAHYNPFPRINKKYGNYEDETEDIDELTEFMNDEDIKESSGRNKEIVEDLEKKLEYNIQKYGIHSPSRNEVIIIDEVMNFIRKILNNSGPSRIFYDWIVNAKNIKLVFLKIWEHRS